MDERERNKGVVRKYIENKLHKRGKKCITQAVRVTQRAKFTCFLNFLIKNFVKLIFRYS